MFRSSRSSSAPRERALGASHPEEASDARSNQASVAVIELLRTSTCRDQTACPSSAENARARGAKAKPTCTGVAMIRAPASWSSCKLRICAMPSRQKRLRTSKADPARDSSYPIRLCGEGSNPRIPQRRLSDLLQRLTPRYGFRGKRGRQRIRLMKDDQSRFRRRPLRRIPHRSEGSNGTGEQVENSLADSRKPHVCPDCPLTSYAS